MADKNYFRWNAQLLLKDVGSSNYVFGVQNVDATGAAVPAGTTTDPDFVKVQNSSGTVIDPATSTKQAALGTLGTPSADVLTMQGGAAMYPLSISGKTAGTIASITNPFPTALYIDGGTTPVAVQSTSSDTMGSSGTAASLVANSIGRIWNGSNFSRAYQISAALTSTGTGVTAVATAPASASNITASTSAVKSGAGMLGSIIVNTTGIGTITVYDSLTQTGTKLATITTAAGQPVTIPYNIAFGTGLSITITGTLDLTITYR